jgi:hypothetical protein
MSSSLIDLTVEFGPISNKLIEAKNHGSVTLEPPTIAHLHNSEGKSISVEITKIDYAGIQKDGRHGYTATSSDGGAFPMNVDAVYGGISATIVNR